MFDPRSSNQRSHHTYTFTSLPPLCPPPSLPSLHLWSFLLSSFPLPHLFLSLIFFSPSSFSLPHLFLSISLSHLSSSGFRSHSICEKNAIVAVTFQYDEDGWRRQSRRYVLPLMQYIFMDIYLNWLELNWELWSIWDEYRWGKRCRKRERITDDEGEVERGSE